MKYDDASWHYGGDFPASLPQECGATHIGMFVAWCQLNGLGGSIHKDDFPEMLSKLEDRALTPGAWFISACDEKFTDEDLNEEGNEFALVYYQADKAPFNSDYDQTVCAGLDSVYEVPDTWETFDKLSPVIQKQYNEWKNQKG
jgi:hypothetical protein